MHTVPLPHKAAVTLREFPFPPPDHIQSPEALFPRRPVSAAHPHDLQTTRHSLSSRPRNILTPIAYLLYADRFSKESIPVRYAGIFLLLWEAPACLRRRDCCSGGFSHPAAVHRTRRAYFPWQVPDRPRSRPSC